jgi:hypothetical protein
MSSLLDEFVALRKHLAENFIENGILEKNKADRRKYGVFETKMGVFCYGFHGSGSIFFDIFRRTIVDSQSFEKWKLFSIQNFKEFAIRGGLLLAKWQQKF